jgi:peptidoglycan hydrolase-like protein with peptidoglycan-binding domain
MPDNAWRDINDPIFLKPKKNETPAADPDDAPPRKVREPPPTEYSITSVRAVEPPHGFEPTKPYDIEGEVELIGKITQPRIVLHPIGLYQGRVSNLVPAGVDAFIDIKTLKFKATCMYLRQPYEYWSDRARPADATWDLVIRAEGNTAQKPIESEKVTFPQPTKFVVLKKDDYDENGAQKYNKPQSGESFKPRNVVKALQNDLINTGFLPKGADDGYFGDQTDKAVQEFQDYAIKPERMERQIGKLIKTDRKLEQAQPDGIVGKKTRDEIDWWLQEGWIKPIESLRYDDYDVEAINKGIKPHRPYGRDASTLNKMRTDDYHEVGTPVLDAQKALAGTNAYTGALDGWFGDTMKAAVTLFQEAAEKGEFLIDGVLTDIGEKLTGFRKGVLCPKTKEYLPKVTEKKGTVVKDRFPLPKANRDKGYHSGARAFGSNRSGGRVHAGCDLYAPAGTKVFAIADGTIKSYYDYYWQTYALEVEHNGKIILYGEIQPPKDGHGYTGDLPAENLRNGLPDGIKAGTEVKRGQHIAYVGQLRPLDTKTNKRYNFSDTMVHFEMYKGTSTGKLSEKENTVFDNVPKKNYMRRKDLMNPTETLDTMDDE